MLIPTIRDPFTAWDVNGLAATILEAQRAQTADEGDTRSRYDRAQSAYDTANTELKNLVSANVRTVGQVQADIDAVKVPGKILEYTNNCTDFEKDLPQFRRSCQPLLQLRSQMADARRKGEKASDAWRPFTAEDSPPQEHDAKCGFACHTVVQNRDYVFTNYARR